MKAEGTLPKKPTVRRLTPKQSKAAMARVLAAHKADRRKHTLSGSPE